MTAIDIALVATAAVFLALLIPRVVGANPNVPLWGMSPWFLGLAVLVEGLAKVHSILPAGLGSLDQVTLWVFVWALVLQVAAGVLAVVNEELDFGVSIRDEPVPYSQGQVGGFRGGGSGVLWWFYTHKGRNNLGDGRGGNRYEDTRWFSPPKRPFNLPAREVSAFQRLLRQLSLLSLAVVAIVRFAHGEPILNLFGA